MQLLNFIFAFLFLLTSASAGGWYETCQKWSNIVLAGSTLYAGCAREDGSTANSQLDFNTCIGNRCGNLVSGFGGFAYTCSGCDFTSASNHRYTATLGCWCTDCNGYSHYTEINTNNFISNQNGALTCD